MSSCGRFYHQNWQAAMSKKVKITAVSYLNTKPFIYGIYRSPVAELIDLQLDIPSVCARKLVAGEVDLALMPVGALPELGAAGCRIVSDFCIGAVGAVETVCLFSDVPLGSIEKIYLDFHSRTSVELVRLLCREFWQINPQFLPAPPDFLEKTNGTTAALVIGDRTIGLAKKHRHVFDLAEAWMQHTGLPFVFAAWVSRRDLPDDFLIKFNAALQSGLDHLPELVKILPTIPDFDVEDYFRRCISYDLDEAKWAGLQLFLEKIGATLPLKLPSALQLS